MRYVSKKFLNQSAYETGSIVVYVETPENAEGMRGYSGVESEVKISDCNKFITLDMSVNKDSDLENRLGKINVMISELTDLKDHLIEQWKYIKDNRPGEDSE